MRFITFVPAAALVAGATAKTVRVDAGTSSLAFSPDNVKANMGDVVEFHFASITHSVAEGDKNNACQPASNGFYSGYLFDAIFQITVNSTDAIYYYSTVPGECSSGMVGVINGDGSGLSAYRSAAAKAEETAPDRVGGGRVISGGATPSTPSATSPSSGNGAASQTTAASTDKPGDAVGVKASVTGVVALAGCVAAIIL